jgi:hypothetical protein
VKTLLNVASHGRHLALLDRMLLMLTFPVTSPLSSPSFPSSHVSSLTAFGTSSVDYYDYLGFHDFPVLVYRCGE